MTHACRVLLIRASKFIPFFIAFIVLLSYAESLIAILSSCYIETNDYTTLHKYISPIIAYVFVYDWITIIVMLFLSICFESCVYNKLCIGYLALNLLQKNVFINISVAINIAVIACVINIAIATFFIYKGLTKVSKCKK